MTNCLKLFLASLSFLFSTALWSQGQPAPQACTSEQAGIQAAADKSKPGMKNIEDEAKSIDADKEKANIKGTLDIKMNEQKWVLKIPEVTVSMSQASFDVPTTTMKTQTISFDSVETTMANTKCGQYPETVVESCLQDGPFGTKYTSICTTVRWHDIICTVPQFKNVRKEISMDIPEFSMTRWSLDVPNIQTTMKEQTWILKIPEITVRDFTVESQKLKDRGNKLQTNANLVQQQEKSDISNATAVFYSCQSANLRKQKVAINAKYADAISKMDNAIQQVRSYGIDPSKVKDSAGNIIDLTAQRQTLVDGVNKADGDIDKQADKLDADARKLVAEASAS